jgi:hypothetical protein
MHGRASWGTQQSNGPLEFQSYRGVLDLLECSDQYNAIMLGAGENKKCGLIVEESSLEL